jgi:hypothetical protein
MAISTPPALHSVCQFLYRETGSVVWRTQNNRSAMLSPPVRRSACQFVYRGILGAICRARNNGGPILSPPAREPAIQNVAIYKLTTGFRHRPLFRVTDYAFKCSERYN